MPIFGTLQDFSLPDVLALVKYSTGRLVLKLNENIPCELHLHNCALKALIYDGEHMLELNDIQESMLTLLNNKEGSFFFEKTTVQKLFLDIDVSTDKLLLSASALLDEIKTYQNHFPHPSTCFTSGNIVDMEDLDDDLYDFWLKGSGILFRDKGASAQELGGLLNLDLQLVQLNLYKLSSLNKIYPVRAYQAEQKANTIENLPQKLPNASYTQAETNIDPKQELSIQQNNKDNLNNYFRRALAMLRRL